MKFECSKAKLLEGINIVSKAISTKSTRKILECILIDVEEGGFKLLANDLEMAIETKMIDCTTEETGRICLEAKLFTDIVRHLPNDTLTVKSDENFVTFINSGKSKFKILGSSYEEFPSLPDIERDSKFTLNPDIFRNMIRQTIFSVSTDESRLTLNGELMDIKRNFLLKQV